MNQSTPEQPDPCTPERDRAISLLAAGDLSGEKAEQLRDHMENCEQCRTAHGYRREMASYLQQDVRAPGPSEKRREQAVNRMMAAHQKKNENRESRRYLSALGRWGVAAIFLFGIIAVIPLVSGRVSDLIVATAVEDIRLEVKEVTGDVTARDRSGIEHPVLETGTVLNHGARIWTGTRSSIRLESAEGETITLDSLSHLRVGRRNNKEQLELFLVEGSLSANTEQTDAGSGGVLILTEGGRIESTEGTSDFEVSVR